ncbi:methionyl-tRNA formyltransferase [Azospira oryzae PS]|uniref:Methionyl-tRNA formyltransferase n=1 Tax=Azospira oryzae (strain ATCC BAA-33 / DSM 13638 / PS) TaxID=640081 RepID=G8QHS2_AZOOP|nr:methionyl-tRNA formyltransferase [Azospira oryzae]AEV25223.1 methionyl-tRNA formyltransferase [Azospira oryzae PS]
MKIVFAGTPEFAARALAALYEAGHDIPLVLTQPDRPAGRGMTLQASPVKQLALSRGSEVFQPLTLKDEAAQEKLRLLAPDVMVVAAYGLILPQAVLDIPRHGCLNIHASLLPRWRGAAPIHRAILAGDAESGVCIMQMEAGLDTGPVLLSASTAITAQDTSQTLHDKLAVQGAQLIVSALQRLPLPAVAQPEAGVTYAAKLDKSEAPLDWRRPAAELDRQIRAFTPFPGTTAVLDGAPLKVWAALPRSESGVPGTVLAADKHGILVACGSGSLLLTELQKAGGKRLPVAQFLAGHGVSAGARFELPAA